MGKYGEPPGDGGFGGIDPIGTGKADRDGVTTRSEIGVEFVYRGFGRIGTRDFETYFCSGDRDRRLGPDEPVVTLTGFGLGPMSELIGFRGRALKVFARRSKTGGISIAGPYPHEFQFGESRRGTES